MRHQNTVDFSAIEAESFKALKLEPRTRFRQRTSASLLLWIARIPSNLNRGEVASGDFLNHFFAQFCCFGVSELESRHTIPASKYFRSGIFESSQGAIINGDSVITSWYSFAPSVYGYRIETYNPGIQALPHRYLRVLSMIGDAPSQILFIVVNYYSFRWIKWTFG